MTLDDLREKTKAAYLEAAKVGNGLNQKPRFRDMNMRQAWNENYMVVAPFLIDPDSSRVVDPRLLKFHYAGEIYYHAKKHGLTSAMLLRLKRI